MRIKVLILMIFATVQLFAVSQKSIEHYVKQYIEKKMGSPVQSVKTLSSYPVNGTNGWKVYFLTMDVKIKTSVAETIRTTNKVVFNKGGKIAFSLKDKQGKDYAKILKPKVPSIAYDKKHLLVGNKNAKHKILLMSDPFCPFCQEIVPVLIDEVKANPNLFALYYYHLPLLKIHPAADITTKAMHLFQERGEIEKLKACYRLAVSGKERNPKVILDAIKKKTGVSFSLEELNTLEIYDALEFDFEMKKRLMVTGTPTIFIDGTWDPTRFKYKEYLPKK
jgi:protein-disulfide isomerase